MSFLFTRIRHDLNEVSEEQKKRRSNNYIEQPIIPEPIQPTYTPEPIKQNQAVEQQKEPVLTGDNEGILINDENSLIKNPEELSVLPVDEPIVDPYDSLDNLLLSLVVD